MHYVGRTVMHTLLIEYEKGLPKNSPTPKSWLFRVVFKRNQNRKRTRRVKAKERLIRVKKLWPINLNLRNTLQRRKRIPRRIRLAITAMRWDIGRGIVLFTSKSYV